MSPKLSYLVLYTNADQLEVLRTFYERLGLVFVREQHGSGPVHFSTTLESGVVMELYPGPVNDGRIGIGVDSIEYILGRLSEMGTQPLVHVRGGEKTVVIRDPDDRRVELIEKIEKSVGSGT